MAVIDDDWRATLAALDVPGHDQPPLSSNGGVTTVTVEEDGDWAAVARTAAADVSEGQWFVVRVARRPHPGPGRDASLAGVERLLAGGLTLHRSADGSASFRRARVSALYLAPWLTFGGSDKGTLDWLRHLPADAFRLFLLTTQPSPNELFAAAEPLADEAWALPDLVPPSAMPQFIVNFIATRNVDVLHIMNSRLGYDLLPALKSAFPHLRTVVQLHVEEADRSGYCRYVTTRYGNLVDAFSVTSEDLRDKLLRYHVSPSKMHVIYTGLDTDTEFDPGLPPATEVPVRRSGDELHVLYPVRLTAQKQPMVMVRVAAGLREAGASTVIHVVGDGELGAEVRAEVAASGLGDRVLFHGSSHDMAPWYRATDATLLTSCFEGMPFVVFESLGMERPVVVPDVGGTRELVDDQVGFLVARHDDVDAYVNALLALERTPALRAALGAAGRRRIVDGYTVAHMADAHAGLYRRLVAEQAVAGLLA